MLRAVEKLGYYLPWMVGGSIISATGYGLLSLLAPNTPAPNWIGYQVFYGVGSGCTTVGVSFAWITPSRIFRIC